MIAFSSPTNIVSHIRSLRFIVATSVLLLLGSPCQAATTPAFPGAHGGGAETPGGRKGKIIYVTNLNDSGPGSFREAVLAKGPRIVLFKVGGTIRLKSGIWVENPYLTVAGQTAPGGGITISGEDIKGKAPVLGFYRTHDIIIRYLTLRRGVNDQTTTGGTPSNQNNINLYSAYNVIVDRCSLSWGNHNNLGIWGDPGDPVKNITVSYSILSEAPTRNQSTGFNAGQSTRDDMDRVTDVDLHHNYFAHNGHRSPLLKVKRGRIVNNIIFDWWWYGSGFVNGVNLDIIGNLYRDTSSSNRNFPIQYQGYDNDGPNGLASIYVAGNRAWNQLNPAEDNWNMMAEDEPRTKRVVRPVRSQFRRSPFVPLPAQAYPITIDSVDSLETTVLSKVGNSSGLRADGTWFQRRDAIDARVIADFHNGTHRRLDNQKDVGGYAVIAGGTAPADSDSDGMPDAWEEKWGLNVQVDNSSEDTDNDGYTDIEEFLNGTSPK